MRRFSGTREEADIARSLADASRSVHIALSSVRRMQTPRARSYERDLARIVSMLESLGNVSGPGTMDPDLLPEETHAERQRAARIERQRIAKEKQTASRQAEEDGST